MEIFDRRSRRVSTTLVREPMDWGVSVSEKHIREFWLNGVLLVLSSLVLFFGLIIVLPLLAGLLLSAEIAGIAHQSFLVLAFIGFAIVFNIQSRKGPRNALELDCNASELRLGFMNNCGAFVRQRVIPLARVENTFVQHGPHAEPELNFMVGGEQVRIALADAKSERMSEIAAQINEAAAQARNAPRRARIKSSIAGIGAGYREIGNRVVSRVCQ